IVDVWFPNTVGTSRSGRSMVVVGRLAAGVTLEQAASELDAMAARLREQYPTSYPDGLRLHVSALHADLVRDVKPAIIALVGAVAFVLIIACANVANLLLARANGREREFAIRRAVGAGQARIVQQMIVESLLIGVLAGGLGLL